MTLMSFSTNVCRWKQLGRSEICNLSLCVDYVTDDCALCMPVLFCTAAHYSWGILHRCHLIVRAAVLRYSGQASQPHMFLITLYVLFQPVSLCAWLVLTLTISGTMAFIRWWGSYRVGCLCAACAESRIYKKEVDSPTTAVPYRICGCRGGRLCGHECGCSAEVLHCSTVCTASRCNAI